MGIAAADCIEMIDGQQEEVNASSSVQKGYIYEYDRFSQYGKISAGDKLYNFKFDAIKDPFLRADIESSYVELEYDVKFCLQERINKGNDKVETVAYDIVGEKEYSDETIAEWVRSGILSQSEIDAWISKDDCKEERKYRISPYEPLKSREAGKPRSVSTGNIQNPKTHLIDDQEKQICKDIIKDVENPFVSMPKISGGKNYRAQARKYSVGTKTDQNEKALLEKAEALFIKAIQADEQLASTISDLANIYIRLGSYENSYIIKGLQLLDVYDYLLSGESLMHMRIQLIDKSEFKDAQEKILENSIKKCTKKNTLYHYMSKLAGFHLKMGNYEHAKKLFKECAEFLDENKSIFVNYEIMKLWPIRSIIIADYYAGDKEDAIQKAKEFLLSNPDDTTIRSIAEGNADEAEKDEIMDDVVDSIPYDDESMDDTFLVSELFSAYASYVLDSCEYSQVRDRVIDDETGRYIWIPENEDKANGVYDSIAHSSSIFGNDGKLRPGTYAEVADKRLNMAKIAEYCLNNTTDLNLTSKKITLWKGRFIWATAHYMWLAYNINSIKQQSSQDAASYFLIECINMFFKDSNYEFRYEFYDAINRFCIIQSRMSSSDFAQIEIKKAENLNKQRVGPKKVEQEIELMENVVCDTFKKIFDNDSKLAIRMLGTILENSNKEAVLYFVRIFSSLGENLKSELINEFGYNNDWSLQDMLTDYSQELHKSYEVFISDLKETSSLITNSNFGGLERVVNRIENALKNEKMMPLCNTDIERCKKLAEQVNNFITLKSKLSSNYEISQERANSIKNEAAYLHREYMDNPTRVSFDALCDLMELIRDEMVKVSDDITQQSLPEITVENEYEEEGYFPHNEKINLMLLISNGKTGKQCTTASDIQLDIDYDDELKKYIHIGQTHFNLLESLPGGEHSSQQITLHLTNEGVIPDTIFAMKVRVSYQTIKGTGDYVDAVLNLHIKSEDAFEEITNPYGKQTLKPGESNEALFKGRSADVANIGNQLLAGGQGKTVLIYGQYRSGKTSLANFIIKEVEMRDESVVMTRSITVAEKDNAWDIVDKIISHICRALRHRYKSLPEVLKEYYTIDVTENNYEKIFTNFTQDLYEVVMEQGIHILVTLDEFGRFFKNNTSDRFMQLWKSVMELGAFNALLIGHDVVTQMMRADINSFGVINTYQINYIDFEATQQVVTEPTRMKDQRTRFTDNAIQYIWEQSAGNAYYIQLICQATINFMNKRHINIVNEVYVKQAIEEWLNNDADESAYLDYGHPLYLSGEIGENAANERETKIVLDAISRCQNFASIDEIVAFSLEHYGQEEQVTKSIVYSLRARRVVDQDEENGKIFIRCKFYPDFLNSQIIRSIE